MRATNSCLHLKSAPNRLQGNSHRVSRVFCQLPKWFLNCLKAAPHWCGLKAQKQGGKGGKNNFK